MGRGVRFVPEGGAQVEVTVRAIQSRLLLRPSLALNERVIGVLGRCESPASLSATVGLDPQILQIDIRIGRARERFAFLNRSAAAEACFQWVGDERPKFS
jgi:hypothetical protein